MQFFKQKQPFQKLSGSVIMCITIGQQSRLGYWPPDWLYGHQIERVTLCLRAFGATVVRDLEDLVNCGELFSKLRSDPRGGLRWRL